MYFQADRRMLISTPAGVDSVASCNNGVDIELEGMTIRVTSSSVRLGFIGITDYAYVYAPMRNGKRTLECIYGFHQDHLTAMWEERTKKAVLTAWMGEETTMVVTLIGDTVEISILKEQCAPETLELQEV